MRQNGILGAIALVRYPFSERKNAIFVTVEKPHLDLRGVGGPQWGGSLVMVRSTDRC